MNSRVAVVGSVNIDHILRVDHLPTAGETIQAASERYAGGGKGANAALASALDGTPTSLIACVGSDQAAQIALADLRDVGVDLGTVSNSPDVATGSATVIVDGEGSNCIVLAAAANSELTSMHVTRALNDVPDLGVVLTNLEIPDRAVIAAAETAASRDAILIVNPAPARPLPDILLRRRPILTPNEDEIVRLTGLTPQQGASLLHARTGAPVIVTLGEHGALLAHDGRVQHFPAPRVRVVDTSGAGDVFNGTLASQFARQVTIDKAIGRALIAASESTRHAGARGIAASAREHLPTR